MYSVVSFSCCLCSISIHACFCSDGGLHSRGASWAGMQRDWALCVLREFMLQSLICTDSARCGAVQWCLHALKLYLCIYAFGHACMPFEASGLVILPLILPGLAVFGLQFVFHYLIILIGVTARPRVFWTARTQQPGHFS